MDGNMRSELDRLGFNYLPHPLRVGNVTYKASGIIYRRDFVLDKWKPRVFIAGAAFDHYQKGDSGIDVKRASELAYELGSKLGRLEVYLVTGFTPKDSIPNILANGASTAGGQVIGISPNGVSRRQLEVVCNYSMVCTMEINSGDVDVDFAIRDLFNVKAGDTMLAFPGKQGTNDEIGTYLMLRKERPLFLVAGLGGVTDLGRDFYEKLHEGETVVFDARDGKQSIDDFAKEIEDKTRESSSILTGKPSFFINNARKAGVPMVSGKRPARMRVAGKA